MKRALFTLTLLALLGFGIWKAVPYFTVAAVPLVSMDQIQKMIDDEDYDRALKSVRRRLFESPGDEASWVLLGNLYEEKNQPKKAAAIYQKLLSKKRDDALLHLGLGRALYRQNRIGEAVDALNTAQTLAKNSPDPAQAKETLIMTHGLLAEIYGQHTKEYRKAINELQALLNLDPRNWEARYELATDYAYSSQYQNAFREFDGIIKENPGTEIARYAENAIQYVRERRNPGKSRYLID